MKNNWILPEPQSPLLYVCADILLYNNGPCMAVFTTEPVKWLGISCDETVSPRCERWLFTQVTPQELVELKNGTRTTLSCFEQKPVVVLDREFDLWARQWTLASIDLLPSDVLPTPDASLKAFIKDIP